MVILSIGGFCGFISFIMLGVLKNIKLRKEWKYIFSLAAVFGAAGIAYYYRPLVEIDLTRYFAVMDTIRENGVEWALTKSSYSMEFTSNFLFILVANSGNYQLLPLCVTALFYFLILKSSINYASQNQVESRLWCLYLILVFSFFILRFVISGLRNQLAIALFACLFIKEKNNRFHILPWLGYLVCIGLHKSMIIFVIFRLILLLDKKNVFCFFKYALPFWSVGVEWISSVLKRGASSYIRILGERLESYLGFSDFDVRVYLVHIGLTLTLLYIVLLLKKELYNKKNQNYDYFRYFEWVTLFAVGCIAVPILLERVVLLLICISFPGIAALKYVSRPRCLKFSAFFILITLSAGMGAYQLVDAVHHFRF